MFDESILFKLFALLPSHPYSSRPKKKTRRNSSGDMLFILEFNKISYEQVDFSVDIIARLIS